MGSALTVEASKITACSALWDGGGVAAINSSVLTVLTSSFADCVAQTGGAAAVDNLSNGTVAQSNITSCTCAAPAAALLHSDCRAPVLDLVPGVCSSCALS